MQEILLSILRDKTTSTAAFRTASDHLARLVCGETISKLTAGRVDIQTPVGATNGISMPTDIMAVPILRAALALLPAFTRVMPEIPVGLIGVERDQETASPIAYYKKFPKQLPGRAVILDPMLATGGSACLAVESLLMEGYKAEEIYFTGVLAAQEGFARLAGFIPQTNITVAAIDPGLNDKKFIVPGLGDYGDRYFGT